VFVNARIYFVGSDDVPAEAKIEATRDINKALEAGWKGLDIAEIVPLDQVARAHEFAAPEYSCVRRGRVPDQAALSFGLDSGNLPIPRMLKAQPARTSQFVRGLAPGFRS
jgi:hypothetical protein